MQIPVGKKAFLPATLTNTNEYLSLIGDGHFINKSAYHTLKLIERRKAMVEKEMKPFKDQKELFKQRLEFTQKIYNDAADDGVEIVEPYDESAPKSCKRYRQFVADNGVHSLITILLFLFFQMPLNAVQERRFPKKNTKT